MRRILQLLSGLAMIGVILPSILFLAGRTDLKSVHYIMIMATALWFLTTPLWMERKTP